MTLPARAATSPELALFRSPGNWSKIRAAIFHPSTIYTARINQTFPSTDGILELTYDGGSGTLAEVLPDMTLLIGSTAGAWDKGICRIRSVDVSKFYISQTSDIEFADNLYLTVIDDFTLWAKHVLIDSGTVYMDGGIAYSDQHANFDPTPIMGSNRVLKLVDPTVSATFDFSNSYVIDGSAIDTWETTSPTASAGADLDTDTPTLEWDTVGWHLVYLTLTAVNGKSYFGVRYVYIWDDDNQPAHAVIGSNSENVDSGGWEFSLTMFDNCDLDDVRDHAMVILFAEDYYDSDTNQSIGPLAGCENVVLTGWIAKEQIDMNPDQGLVEFTAYTAQYWFAQIPSYPAGVEFTGAAPTAWTEMQNLTVDLGLWHFLHWRTTATRVMDVFLSGDTKYTREVSSLAATIWDQIRDMSFEQIFARAGVNRYNQLFIRVHPNLIPEADRGSIPTVMDIQKGDWAERLNFERVTKPEVSVVAGSGVYVNSIGTGTPYFSLAPGHTYPHYGSIESVDNLLVLSQSQANTFFGLYRSWRNNQFPDIPITFLANNRLIDCFPNQYCSIDIDAADNVRGIAYDGNLIPTSVSFVQDGDYLHTEVTFEAETFESLCVDGDVPGSGDVSVPPTPPLPPLHAFPTFIPGLLTSSGPSPQRVLFLDAAKGLIYTENFDAALPTYVSVNAGLGTVPYPSGGTLAGKKMYEMINGFHVTPSGVVYAWRTGAISAANWNAHNGYFFLARAPSIGSPFVTILDWTSFNAGGITGPAGLQAVGWNPLLPDSVSYIDRNRPGGGGDTNQFHLGTNGSWSNGVTGLAGSGAGSGAGQGLSYGLGKWVVLGFNRYEIISGSGGALLESHIPAVGIFSPQPSLPGTYQDPIARVSTSGRMFVHGGFDSLSRNLCVAEDNDLAHVTFLSDNSLSYDGFAMSPTGQYQMARYGGLLGRGKSPDYGVTWATMGSLPAGNHYFAYAGEGDSGPRFIAMSAIIRLSNDLGTTWINKESASLLAIAPFPDLVHAQALD